MSNMMKNPFILNAPKYYFEEESYDFINCNIRKHFKNVYVFCKFNNNIDYKNILEGNINKDDFSRIIKMFTLYKCDISLIYNKKLSNDIILMESELLKESNYFAYNLPTQILVLPIFNISFLHIQNHIDNITNNLNTFEKFYNELVIEDYYNYDFTFHKLKSLINMIFKLNITSYWEKVSNCNLNINNKFNARMFNYVPIKDKKSNIIYSAMNEIKKSVDYFDDLLENKINKFISKNDVDKKYCNKYYYSKEGSIYTNEHINKIFSFLLFKLNNENITNINENYKNKLIIDFYLKMTMSRELCHHIINNKYILTCESINNIVFKNKAVIDIFINNFKYVWTRFYIEEKIKEGYLKTNDEIVFDIHTASNLPVFKVNGIYNNPYLSIPINNKTKCENVYGIHPDLHKHYMGVNDLKTFRKKLNIFISGDDNFNIFKDINFKKNKMAISGSIMPACLQKNNPLSYLFDNQYENKDYRYYSEYYCNSDIDVMIKTRDVEEYLNITKNIYMKMYENVFSYFKYENLKIEHNKNIYVYITKNFIDENLEHDFNYVKKNICKDEIIETLLPYIIKEHNKYLNELKLSDETIGLVNKFDKSNVNIILYEEQKENYNDITIRFNIKTNISSKYLNRHLELFMIKGDDFMNIVSKFHLPCVRAYYDNENVYMTPSCITAYMTLINMHYTYFSGQTTPMEIINKYRTRGYGIILNKNEIRELFKYSCDTEYWRNLYGFKNVKNITSNIKKFLGFIEINSPFYKPRTTNLAFHIDNDYIDDDYKHVNETTTMNTLLFINSKTYNTNSIHITDNTYNNGNLKTYNKNIFEDIYDNKNKLPSSEEELLDLLVGELGSSPDENDNNQNNNQNNNQESNWEENNNGWAIGQEIL